MKTQILTWAALQKEKLYRKTSRHGAHEKLPRVNNTGFDKAKDWVWAEFAQPQWGYSLDYRTLAEGRFVWSEKKSRHRLPERRGRKWRGQRWLQLLACAVQYVHFQSHTRETAARLWNSPSGTELAHSHKKLLGPSLHFGGLATGLSLGTLIGS